MEDLLRNDSTFELFTNSNDGNMFNNRVLTTMPSEKSSFQIDLGDDRHSNFIPPINLPTDEEINQLKKQEEVNKSKFDPEKLAQGVTSTASAISSVGSTIQAFKGDGTKPKSRRKQLKEVCGRKPLLKKNRGEYDKCVANYNAGGVNDTKAPETTTPTEDTPPPKDNKKIIIIGVVVVAVLVTAFVGYKKGWFTKG